MRTSSLIALLLLAAPSLAIADEAEFIQLSQEQISDGWIALFDGQTLYGWQPTSDADWRVEDGVIHASAGETGFLTTTTEWGDYKLHVEFKCPAETNSGVFLAAPLVPIDPAVDCYELNIAPRSNPFPTGSFVLREKIGDTLPDGVDVSDGGWHAFDVTLDRGVLNVQIDGRQALRYVDPKPIGRGRIGLQFREGPIAFRNVRIKPLGVDSLFNGKDLSGWNTERADASRFEIVDSEIRVRNGRGQLESDGRYGDFVLQLECFVNGNALNSGVFFRCIPGDFMMGYECQIHNGVVDGDPAQPVDGGTGGFYRRQSARRVMASDREWFAMTLVTAGPHMAAWVNGVQVSDWTDERAADENPRRGLRTESGTLAIQGHDPTTDLRFRKLRISELPARSD